MSLETYRLANYLSTYQKPMPHQDVAFNRIIKYPRYPLFMKQGTGKTLPVVGLISYAIQEEHAKLFLIVCPLTVASTWREELNNLLPDNIFVTTTICTGGRVGVEWLLSLNLKKAQTPNVIITNYETLKGHSESFITYAWDIFILDESHYIKNNTTENFRACLALSKKVNRIVGLTGTPMSQSPVDIFNQFKVINPQVFGNNKSHFIDEYCNMDPRYPRKFRSFKNLEGLNKKVVENSYRVDKKDVLKDLPDDDSIFFECSLSRGNREIYDQMRREGLIELSQGIVTAPIALSKLLRLQEICGGYLPIVDQETKKILTYEQVGKDKLVLLQEVVAGLLTEEPTRKIVIFTRFYPEAFGVARVLTELEVSFVDFNKCKSVTSMQKAISAFQVDTDPKVFITQISKGGIGITLTRADTTIFYSTDYSIINYEQAKARVHRKGQTNKVLHIHLLASNTVDAAIYRAIANKSDLASLAVDNLISIMKGGTVNERKRFTKENTRQFENKFWR